MLFVKQDKNGLKLPFFIQWNETDEERRNDLRNIGTITEHKNKVQQIETIHYAVKMFEKQYGNGKQSWS